VNVELPVIREEETYPDHREEDTDKAKNRPGWCDAGDLLRKIYGLDGYTQ